MTSRAYAATHGLSQTRTHWWTGVDCRRHRSSRKSSGGYAASPCVAGVWRPLDGCGGYPRIANAAEECWLSGESGVPVAGDAQGFVHHRWPRTEGETVEHRGKLLEQS